MNLQQLQYIIAVADFGNFTKAADSCEITQSTLSSMIKKLEEELDVVIFDRQSHPVVPTQAGEKVLAQARVILYNVGQLQEMTRSERNSRSGSIRLGIIPTVAPYIIPGLVKHIGTKEKGVKLSVTEMRTQFLIEKLRTAEIDMAIMATPTGEKDLLEIPLYYEKFVAYVSPSETEVHKMSEIVSGDMPTEHLWLLQEGHCLRNQVVRMCGLPSGTSPVYEAGSIDTLVRIVDTVGGYTIIPELHIPYLTEEQKKNLRPFVRPEADREVSIVIRSDYVREGLLNVVAEAVKSIVPAGMLDTRLKKFSIKI
ncbi:MAG: hydrogen peroxide-inducible genes activator [Bacteroidales bacterium]|nr:hydrogen peroxide-inducible genes activator [Bacteroidales bacterium]